MAILEKLLRSPLGYRHAVGILDPQCEEWRPEGKSAYEIVLFTEAPLIVCRVQRAYQLLWEPAGIGIQALVRYLAGRELNVLSVLGEPCYRALRPLLGEGRWTVSRNYGVTGSQFQPRPSDHVRKLGPCDRSVFERACAAQEGLQAPSIRRDFDFMDQGLPVKCYGAFAGDRLVGFCSSNPISRGVTEISKLAVAQEHRRQGLASGLLTAQAKEAFARGDAVGYYAGSAGEDLNAMLIKLGFRELLSDYRFVPVSSPEQWQAWGRPVGTVGTGPDSGELECEEGAAL
jgi:GNAT superfamily N-acetyltransferase